MPKNFKIIYMMSETVIVLLGKIPKTSCLSFANGGPIKNGHVLLVLNNQITPLGFVIEMEIYECL